LLAIRHDRSRVEPDPPGLPSTSPNADRRGNVAFADGHGDYAARRYVHDLSHLLHAY